jgi:hypothetical protein
MGGTIIGTVRDERAERAIERVRWSGIVVAAITVVVLGWLARRTHLPGHDWGDDFALYIRQAEGIVDGFALQVEADNRFALAASGWSTFSPPIYPWGWPLLMTPVIAVFGVDYEALKLLVVVMWCIALASWFALVRARTSALGAWVLLVALGLSWPYATWSNSVVSDLPYLGVAFAALWWMDRCRAMRSFDTGPWWPLVVLGLAMSWGFNIRRDGLALVVAFGALIAVLAVGRLRETGWRRSLQPWRRWALPIAVFIIASSVLQMLLPSVLRPDYPGTGLSNVDDRLEWYRDILAQQLGLLDSGSDAIELFGSHSLGMTIMGAIVALAIIGVVVRCLQHPDSDVPLAAFGLAHTGVVLIAPFQEGRYLFPIVPVLLYFALQSLPTLAGMGSGFRWITITLVAVLAVSSATETMELGDRASELRQQGYITNGPSRPEAIEMTRAVIDRTEPDDVVAFFRARAMTMLTGRRSLQAGSIEPILAGADWYVMERGSTYSQPLLLDDEAEMLGLERVWSNSGWVMFRVPRNVGR